MAVHVRYKSLYISLLSSAKQQREMTKCERWRYKVLRPTGALHRSRQLVK